MTMDEDERLARALPPFGTTGRVVAKSLFTYEGQDYAVQVTKDDTGGFASWIYKEGKRWGSPITVSAEKFTDSQLSANPVSVGRLIEMQEAHIPLWVEEGFPVWRQ